MSSILTMGNVPLQLVDKKKGNMSNRLNCAGETLKNNAAAGLKSYGVIAGTALAYDTFAGNKTIAKNVVNVSKHVTKNFTDNVAQKFKKATTKVVDVAAKNINGVVSNFKNKNLPSKVISKMEHVLNSSPMKNIKSKLSKTSLSFTDSSFVKKLSDKAKSKISNTASKFIKSPFVKTLSKNKKLAILGTGAVALAGVLVKWANNQGRIDQKYEDKAKLAERYMVL